MLSRGEKGLLEEMNIDDLAKFVLENVENVSPKVLTQLSIQLSSFEHGISAPNLYEHYQQEAIRKISSRFSLEQVEALAEGRANIQMI